MPFYAYLLRCSDTTLYAGWTIELLSRLERHNRGLASKYTRTRLPVVIARSWEFETQREAMQFERRLKGLSKAEKEALVRNSRPE